MQRFSISMAWLLCGLLVGCGSATQDEQNNSVETLPIPAKTDSAEKPQVAPQDLPPAPIPKGRLYAKNFINKPAPEFIVQEWLTKKPEYEGKMMMIDFWATWCGPCIRSIPKLNHFHRNHEDRLAVIGVSDESAETVRNHPGAKINYALAIDPKRRMIDTFAVQGIPYVVLIDPTGVVRWQGIGNLMTEELLEEMLDTYVR